MTEASTAIGVVGTFVGTPNVVWDRSLEEMIFAAAEETVAAAGMSLDELDGIVISGNDQVEGRVISCMVTSGPAAGVGRDLTMLPSASEHALAYAYLRLLAGQGRNALVLSWGKPSESVAPEHADLVAAEPFLLRRVGLNDTIAAALHASVAAKGNVSASEPRGVFPLSTEQIPEQGDCVCGLVLAREGCVPSPAGTAWIRGLGWATDRYDLGDRNLLALPALRRAAEQARGMADSLQADGGVFVSCGSEHVLPLVRDALDVDPEQDTTLVTGSPDSSCAYPTHPRGLIAMASAARKTAVANAGTVAVSLHGFAGQGAAVALFGPDPEEAR